MGLLNIHNGVTWKVRFEKILEYIFEFFGPEKDDSYFILDPYIIPGEDLFIPFKNYQIDSKPLSMLIDQIVVDNTNIQIITTKLLTEFKNDNCYPIKIYYPEKNVRVNIEVCRYPNKSYFSLELHDRWILRENKKGVKGLHIGPSIGDFVNKDVTITEFNHEIINNALDRFKNLWNISLKYKSI